MRAPTERPIEDYLKDKVREAGGFTRKWVSPGRRNVMDQIVIWPGPRALAKIHFVECKAPGKGLRSGQEREAMRFRDMGCVVLCLDTKVKVDNYVRVFK